MCSDPSKLFVGGISWGTSEDILKDHFHQYGSVVGCVVMRDRKTGSPRGFGFVWFSDPSSADRALRDNHVIVGRTVEVKRAIPRGEQNQNSQSSGLTRSSSNQFRTKKIFVGGLAPSVTEDEFRSYFEKFGRITDIVVMQDSMTQRPRGFGFITFKFDDSIEKVMERSFHELNGKRVEVKRAIPKKESNNSDGDYKFITCAGGLVSPYDCLQHWMYPPYGPRVEFTSGYIPVTGYTYAGQNYLYGPNTYGTAYPMGGYGGTGYGATDVAPRGAYGGTGYEVTGVACRDTWNGSGMVFPPDIPFPLGNTAICPGILNVGGAGVMGAVSFGYNGGIAGPRPSGKLNQAVSNFSHVTLPRVDGGRSDVDISS